MTTTPSNPPTGPLAQLTPEQLQAPIERRRKAAVAGAIGADGILPVSKADVIEYATDLLLVLPTLSGWSCDPLLAGSGDPFSVPMTRS